MAVGFESDEIHLYRLRERLRAMSDEALIAFGKYAKSLCGIRVSGTPDPYKIQLDEARREWRGGVQRVASPYMTPLRRIGVPSIDIRMGPYKVDGDSPAEHVEINWKENDPGKDWTP